MILKKKVKALMEIITKTNIVHTYIHTYIDSHAVDSITMAWFIQKYQHMDKNYLL